MASPALPNLAGLALVPTGVQKKKLKGWSKAQDKQLAGFDKGMARIPIPDFANPQGKQPMYASDPSKTKAEDVIDFVRRLQVDKPDAKSIVATFTMWFQRIVERDYGQQLQKAPGNSWFRKEFQAKSGVNRGALFGEPSGPTASFYLTEWAKWTMERTLKGDQVWDKLKMYGAQLDGNLGERANRRALAIVLTQAIDFDHGKGRVLDPKGKETFISRMLVTLKGEIGPDGEAPDAPSGGKPAGAAAVGLGGSSSGGGGAGPISGSSDSAGPSDDDGDDKDDDDSSSSSSSSGGGGGDGNSGPPPPPPPPPPPNGRLVLDGTVKHIERTNKEQMATFALFCYKRGWDKVISFAYRGVPVAQYIKHVDMSPTGSDYDEKKDRRVKAVLVYLPMDDLRRLSLDFTQEYEQELTQVEPMHNPFDTQIRPRAGWKPELNKWAQLPGTQEQLRRFLAAMPPQALGLEPRGTPGHCSLRFRLDENAWSDPRDKTFYRLLLQKARANSFDLANHGKVYPIYPAVNNMLHACYQKVKGNCGPSQHAYDLMQQTTGRMIAALDHVFSKQGGPNGADLVLWRGVDEGRYKWAEEPLKATPPDKREFVRRLIASLQATYFSASYTERVGERFMTSGGILIKFVGSCRGIPINPLLNGPWECYRDEDEVLVAPQQTYTFMSEEYNQNRAGKSRMKVITLQMTYAEPAAKSVWVDTPDDPHFELHRMPWERQ